MHVCKGVESKKKKHDHQPMLATAFTFLAQDNIYLQ